MDKIISVMNQKGGVGKTTTTLNLAAALRDAGKKILLIDFDPQANLTSSAGIQSRELSYTVYDFIKGCEGFDDVVIKTLGMDLIPSAVDLSGADIELSHIVGRETLLKQALDKVKTTYDCILIDCPPTLGLLSLNALTASGSVLIPMQAGYLPLEGLSLLFETLELVRDRINETLSVCGILITMFNGRQRLQKEVVELLRERFHHELFETHIRCNVSLAEAPSFGEDIFTYKKNSIGALDYTRLCKEVIAREGI